MKLKEKFYLTTDELVKEIKSKGIKIRNERKTKIIIEHNNNYYITGYKELFKNSSGSYKDNVYFKDIYNIYDFDKKIKLLFTEILFEIEQNVKTVFSNNFCKRYGYTENELLDINNYDKKNKYVLDVLNKLRNQINWYGISNASVMHYVDKYTGIPIWVLVKVLSFGMIRDLIFCQDSGVKGYVAKKLAGNKKIKTKDVQNLLELLVTYRNICCHDDKLIGYVNNKINIMDTPYHKHFNLKKDKNGLYIQGKKDMFAALIAIKYFVDRRTYTLFINRISKLIDEYVNKMDDRITRDELLKYMNLPSNFTEIKRL